MLLSEIFGQLEQIEWMNLYKQIHKKQKFMTFPATEDKEVKLLTTQQN